MSKSKYPYWLVEKFAGVTYVVEITGRGSAKQKIVFRGSIEECHKFANEKTAEAAKIKENN